MSFDLATRGWGVVVPVKRLDVAKSRLASYGDEARRALALAFAVDVVTAALECPVVRSVLVVTHDPEAAHALALLGAQVAPDDPDAGLNPALSHGADLLLRSDAAVGVATVSSDLPALRAQDLTEALDAVADGGRGFVADAGGSGTTLLAAAGTALLPSYGAGSRERHLASGAVDLGGAPGLRRDVDTPQDLLDALALGVGARTARVVADLPALRGAGTMGR